MSVEEDTSETPALSTVSSESVRSLREQVQHYSVAVRTASTVDEQEHYRALQRSVSGVLAKLLDSARKLQQDGLAAVERMSFKERAELFITWYSSLPPVHRETLRVELEKHESGVAVQ